MFRIVVGCLLFVMGAVAYAQTAQSLPVNMTNVRSGPSTEYSIRAGFWSRSELTVTGKSNFVEDDLCVVDDNYNNDLWLRVDVQGIEGWVNYCLVTFEGDLSSLPVADPAYPEPDEWINMATIPQNSLFFTIINDELGTAPDVPYVTASTRRQYFIHVRENPNLGATILDHLSGAQIYVTGVGADGVWVQVEYDARLSSCYEEADSVDECPPERLSGWVARYLLRLPTGWQDVVPVVES